ncbi:hypothetical protein AAY473_009898 [Plecturocebus cupreus]
MPNTGYMSETKPDLSCGQPAHRVFTSFVESDIQPWFSFAFVDRIHAGEAQEKVADDKWKHLTQTRNGKILEPALFETGLKKPGEEYHASEVVRLASQSGRSSETHWGPDVAGCLALVLLPAGPLTYSCSLAPDGIQPQPPPPPCPVVLAKHPEEGMKTGTVPDMSDITNSRRVWSCFLVAESREKVVGMVELISLTIPP